MTRQVNKMINNEGGKYPKFSPVYARAREEAKKKAEAELEKHIINRVELLAYLTDIFMDPNASTRDKIKAGELLAKLLGLYESRLNVNMNANPFAKLTTEELQKLAGEQ